MNNRRPSLLFVALAACFAGGSLQAQQHAVSAGVNYTYVRTNVLPGCSCVSLNGGGAQVEAGITSHLQAIADFTATQRGNITPDNYQLTLLTYTFGVRYRLLPARRFSPFGEALLGGAHALGTLSPGNNAIGGSSNALAFQTGGGLSFRLSQRLRIVPAQADFLLTNFQNNQQNRQNDLRLSAGVLFRLRR